MPCFCLSPILSCFPRTQVAHFLLFDDRVLLAESLRSPSTSIQVKFWPFLVGLHWHSFKVCWGRVWLLSPATFMWDAGYSCMTRFTDTEQKPRNAKVKTILRSSISNPCYASVLHLHIFPFNGIKTKVPCWVTSTFVSYNFLYFPIVAKTWPLINVWSGPLSFAITELKLSLLSLVQTTIGLGKPCRTGSPVHHMIELYPSRW